MKKARYNKYMKAHKKLILVAATVLVVGGAGTGVALAMQDEPKKVATEQSSSVEPQNEPVEAVVEQEPTPEPVVQEEVVVEPQETVDSVLNAAEWNEADRECVDMIRERAPRWFTDVETTKKFIDVTDHYVGMCYGVWQPSTPEGLNRQFQVKTDLDMGIIQQ